MPTAIRRAALRVNSLTRDRRATPSPAGAELAGIDGG